MKRADSSFPLPLQRWLWSAFVRSAIIPLLLIELGFLLVYWVSSRLIYDANVATITKVSESYFSDVATREASAIGETLAGIENLTRLFVRETHNALITPYDPPASEKARYILDDKGVFRTVRNNGTTATFYSNLHPIGKREIDKVWRTSQIDHVLAHIKNASPLINQVYFNTYDSYNRIYPYMDATTYPPDMDIPSYNFYYEADKKHNPGRKPVWTDAYIDPAGLGWMVSSIAPVYIGNRLEAVTGIDVTIKSIVNHVLNTRLPWQGYAMLIGRDGTIIATSPAGEKDLRLGVMKDYRYSKAILSDTFRPDSFNINKRKDTQKLAAAIFKSSQGVIHLDLAGGRRAAAFAEVPGPGWRLVVLAPESEIYASAAALEHRLRQTGILMVIILVLFYIGFFVFLYYRSRRMSQTVARPLEQLSTIMDSVGSGEFRQRFSGSSIHELDRVGNHLLDMSDQLAAAQQRNRLQERQIAEALEKERETSASQRRFIRVMSHEIRTPLAIVDSSAQIMERRATSLTAAHIVDRANRIRRATGRMANVINRLVRLLEIDSGKQKAILAPLDISELLEAVCTEFSTLCEERPLRITIEKGIMVEGDRELIRLILTALLENAHKYSPAGKSIYIHGYRDDNQAMIAVTDQGSGVPVEDRPYIFDRFYRGSNAATTTGAGVGLHLAHVFARSNRGSIIIGDSEDGGACVQFRIPLLAVACDGIVMEPTI